MKKLLMVAALSAAGMVSTGAQAQATGNFDVVINLTAACQLGAIPNMTFNYTSFQVGNSNASTNYDVSCSTGLPYDLSLDQTAVTDAVVGLDYTLSFTGGTGPFNGMGVAVSHEITGVIAGGQGGNCAAGVCDNTGSANRQRTLTVTF